MNHLEDWEIRALELGVLEVPEKRRLEILQHIDNCLECSQKINETTPNEFEPEFNPKEMKAVVGCVMCRVDKDTKELLDRKTLEREVVYEYLPSFSLEGNIFIFNMSILETYSDMMEEVKAEAERHKVNDILHI